MRFNEAVIQHIFEEQFWDMLVQKVDGDVQRLDDLDFVNDFDAIADSFELDSIENACVESYDTETDGDETIVSGEMSIEVVVDGFAYHDGETFAVGSTLLSMIYTFSFRECNGKFDDLYLEYVY